MIDEETVRKAVEVLLEAAPSGSKVILFGSHARGTARPESDLDFLVVEPEVKSVHKEMVRLRLALDRVVGPLLVPTDVLVVSREHFRHWQDTPSTVYHEAAREGKAYERIA